jgi:dTDP-glucose pyrophosphorylase/CBS domain-containing protein
VLTEHVIGRVRDVLVSPEMPLAAALEPLDRAGLGVLLLADADRRLIGVLTDGDVRRAILRKQSLSDPCKSIATLDPITAPPTVTRVDALRLFESKHGLSHLPIVDADRHILGLLLRIDLIADDLTTLSAVIMAGGFGTRLQPLTDDVPKPLLPIGDRPIMEHLVDELKAAGIRHLNVTTHFQSEKIREHFGDGERFGMEFEYVSEDRPLGTAGALSLMKKSSGPLLVVNGDILTRVDFRSMMAFHRQHNADLTVAVRQHDMQVPYGVVECDGVRIKSLREKPTVTHLVNAGMYLLEPSVHDFIQEGQHLDMTTLIGRLLGAGRMVVSFPVVEYWLDIGQHADYERAQRDAKSGRIGR